MAFWIQPLTQNLPNSGVIDSGGWTASPTLRSLIVSLSIAVMTLALGIAAVFSVIAWAVG